MVARTIPRPGIMLIPHLGNGAAAAPNVTADPRPREFGPRGGAMKSRAALEIGSILPSRPEGVVPGWSVACLTKAIPLRANDP